MDIQKDYNNEFGEIFWAYNYPVQIYLDKEKKTFTFTGYMPRKNSCFESEVFGMELLPKFIDNTIKTLEAGVEKFKQLKSGEIDHVYYWDND